jgi:hypothetical protein
MFGSSIKRRCLARLAISGASAGRLSARRLGARGAADVTVASLTTDMAAAQIRGKQTPDSSSFGALPLQTSNRFVHSLFAV